MNAEAETPPSFAELERVIKGEKEPSRVHLVELGVDQEVVRFITENVFEHEWVPNTYRWRITLP